jgi:3-phosphoshikimate 1-carboxyvinyltransferase
MRWIKHSEVDGKIEAPPSKSMMIRATAAGLLSEGESQIINPAFCDDALASVGIIKSLGAEVRNMNQELIIHGGIGPVRSTSLDCNESGLCLRMFTPIASLFREEITLEGKGSLLSRPIGNVEDPLGQLGCHCRTNRNRPPVKVKGPPRGGKVHIDGSLSSQFLTGLLMALPLCEAKSEITVSDLRSKPYISMTLSLLSDFGINIDHDDDLDRFYFDGLQHYQSRAYFVEGDWSGASFFLVAAAIGGRVWIRGLSLHTDQADLNILDAIELAGAKMDTQDNFVLVERDRLNAFEFDATHCPDLFPPLVVLASSCQGRSVIHGVDRLFFKESNRATSLINEFQKIGARIEVEENRMIIKGNCLKGGKINSHGDHRIAMAAAVAGIISKKGVVIENWQCVSKSYPRFFEDLESISRRTR